ncbi:MAG: DMT family transporter [Pseudomonadota bacterium]
MTTQKSISGRAWAELFTLGAIWGASFLSIRIALDEIGFLTSVAHRVLWATLLLWGVVIALGLAIPKAPRIWAAFLVMGLLNNVIPFGLMAWGQLHIESGLTSIFNAATAMFGVIAAAMFFADEKLTAQKTIGVCVGFLGVVIAIGPGALTSFDMRSLAQLAVLGGTVSYALASVWARKFLGGLVPQVAAAGMLTGSTLIIVPVAWSVEGPMSLHLQTDTYLAIGYYSLIATAGAYLLYYRVLAMAGSGNLMLCTLIIVPFAISLGAWVRGESLSANSLFGFGLLALGLIVLDGRLSRLLIDRRHRQR